jgi:hypothetical protein
MNKRNKRLARLISAFYDMHRAVETAERILNLPPDFPHADDVVEDLMLVFVMCYSRPFTENTGVGCILNEYPNYPTFGDTETKLAHDRMIYIRNNLYAHANVENLGVEIVPPGVANRVTGEARSTFDFNIGKRSFIRREYVAWLMKVPLAFKALLRLEIESLIANLFKASNPTSAFELQTGYIDFAWGAPPIKM